MTVTWDYTELASFYDKRADYSAKALDRLCAAVGVKTGAAVADIGAGTGKLAIPLARRDLRVSAVEPNNAMRALGVRNSEGLTIDWSEGTGERTHLASDAFDLATFGSSFNVVDQRAALHEVARILKEEGSLACMWNHRDLEDALQARIETIIQHEILNYSYGKRREDPTSVIESSGLFAPPSSIKEGFLVQIRRIDFIDAWRSHATLQRQAGAKFNRIIDLIDNEVERQDVLSIPYFTRIWYARRNKTTGR